jgi:hypothetical protein
MMTLWEEDPTSIGPSRSVQPSAHPLFKQTEKAASFVDERFSRLRVGFDITDQLAPDLIEDPLSDSLIVPT